MRQFLLLFLALTLALSVSICAAEDDDDSFVVVEDEDSAAPDPHYQALSMMRRMTDEQKIYQLFIVTLEQLTGDKRTAALPTGSNVFEACPVGGVMLFGQNIESEEQLQMLTMQLNVQSLQAGLYPLFIASEEEGGSVARVANKLGYPLTPSPTEIGEAGDENVAWAAGVQIGKYLKTFGINLCFAPPADTFIELEDVGRQFYGSDPELVSRMASAMAKGLRSEGVVPCYTHFPGHGSLEGYTLKNLSVKRTLNEMRAWEWIPFRDGIEQNIEMILVSHALVRTLESDTPASTSNRVINGLLRGELNYQGCVVTDALRMTAATYFYKTGQESVAALKAGADILLLPPDLDAAVKAIRTAISQGDLTMARIEESVVRILEVKIRMSMIQ